MNIELISIILSYASFGSLFIPFLIFVYYKAFNNQLKALFFYITSSILTEVIGICSINYSHVGIPVFYMFTVSETILVCYLFLKEIANPFYKKIIKIGLFLFVATSISILLISKSFEIADNFSRPIEFAFITVLSIFYFYKVFTDLKILDLTEHPFFWINSAFLLYFGTSFIFFLLLPYAEKDNKIVIATLGIFHLIISTIYNILLATGVWKIKRT